MQGLEQIAKQLKGAIDRNSETKINEVDKKYVKSKTGVVEGYDTLSSTAIIKFPDIENTFIFYNKSGELLKNGNTVKVEYTNNLSQGIIVAKYGVWQSSETDVNNGSSSKGTLKEYQYLSDTSIKYNDLTYTVEKNDLGLITKIYDDKLGEFAPEISGEITDIAFHNAVFTAIAMLCGLSKSELDDTLTEMVQYRYNDDVSVVTGSSISWSNQAVGASNLLVWTGSSKQDVGIYISGAVGSIGTLTYAPDAAVDEYTIYLVACGATTSSVRVFNSSGNGSFGTAASIYNDGGLWCVTNYVNGSPLASSSVPITSKAVVVIRRKTDGTLEYWVNGNLIDASTTGVQLAAGSFSFGWTFALSGLYDGNGFYFYDFALAETAHSEEDILTNSKYLMSKYNITT